jgi:hypothetical protein
MRPQFFDPVSPNPSLPAAEKLARDIYRLHEAGASYTAELRQLGLLAGRIVSVQQVLGGFGSIDPETFARKCLVDWHSLPTDATEAEMLEMVQLVCQAEGTEFQVEYWVECLRVNTGDERISDLIFWPDEYFGKSTSKELSAEEILEVALGRAGGELAV